MVGLGIIGNENVGIFWVFLWGWVIVGIVWLGCFRDMVGSERGGGFRFLIPDFFGS